MVTQLPVTGYNARMAAKLSVNILLRLPFSRINWKLVSAWHDYSKSCATDIYVDGFFSSLNVLMLANYCTKLVTKLFIFINMYLRKYKTDI